MKLSIQHQLKRYREWRKGVLVISLLEILLLAVVTGIVIMTIYVCTRSTRGPLSIKALRDHLNDLQVRFKNPLTINAETERKALEILLNDVKGSCDKELISGNVDLKEMFDKTCKQIRSITANKEVGTKSSWLKLNAVSSGFNEFYFR
jgi:hypothetical protein